jgi:death on curing protein
MTEYLNAEQLAEVNRRVLKEVKVKRADSHRVANRKKLESIVEEVRAMDADVFEKATCLLVGLTKKHAFDSGNRRTAYTATKLFLEANGEAMKADPDRHSGRLLSRGGSCRMAEGEWHPRVRATPYLTSGSRGFYRRSSSTTGLS